MDEYIWQTDEPVVVLLCIVILASTVDAEKFEKWWLLSEYI